MSVVAQYELAFEHAHSNFPPSSQRTPVCRTTGHDHPLIALHHAEMSHSSVALSEDSFCIPSLSAIFPRSGRFHECSWLMRAVPLTNTLYLNPLLFHRYEKGVDKRHHLALLSLMYCIVIHEFSDLLITKR
jgi:hypothetical protein